MARQNQILPQRPVVATRTALTQEQSVETVQVMLYSSISMLCGVRQIFDPSAYENIELAEDDEPYTFVNLSSGKAPLRAQPGSPSSSVTRLSEPNRLAVPLLKRGRSTRADMCLDMLTTVFEALHRKSLRSFRFGIVTNPTTTQDLLELYNFGVIYKESPDNVRDIQGLETTIRDEETYDQSLDVQGCVIVMLGRLYDLCKDLPPLPSNRFLTASIRYMDDGWEPKEFTISQQPEASVIGFEGWQPRTTDLGLSGGISHDVSLQVAFLNHEYSITRRMSQDLKVSRRNDGHNSRPTTKTMTPPIRSRTSAGLKSRTQSRVLEIPKTPTRSVLSEDEAPNSTTVHGGSKHATNDDVPVAAVPIEPRVRSSAMGTVLQDRTVSKQPSHLDTSNPSHTDDDARRKNSLDDMLEPSLNPEDNFATQPRRNASQASSDSALADHMALYEFLSREKAIQLWGRKQKLQKKTSTLAKGWEQRSTSCQCQREDVMEDMVQCSICDLEQHLVCQGLLNDEVRQLSLHVCFRCLFAHEADGNSITEELRVLALQRRAMDLLLSEQVEDEVEMGNRLGMQSGDVAALLERLVAEGFVAEQGRRRTRNSQVKIAFPDSVSTAAYTDKLERLFDPSKLVGHHYSEFMTSTDSSAHLHQALTVKYPLLTRASDQRIASALPERKRTTSVMTGNQDTDDTRIVASKRARTNSSGSGREERASTPRRSQRIIKVTPKMKESTFDFFINGRNLPSRENSATKSVRFQNGSGA